MKKTDVNDISQPSMVETEGHDDQGYELRYMSGALPAEVQVVTSSQVSLHHTSPPTPTSIPNVQRSDPAFNPQLPSLPTFIPGTPLEAASRTSLEILESTNHPSNGNALSRNLTPNAPLAPDDPSPIDISLPSSGSLSATSVQQPADATRQRHSARFRRHSSSQDRASELSRYFPHLSCVQSPSRHDNANITIFDYFGHVLCGSRPISMDFTVKRGLALPAKLEKLRSIVRGNNLWPNVDTRLIIIEDLSAQLIHFLGLIFDLSPELFEEHLHQSVYRTGEVNEPSPETWSTSNLQKSYVSMKWYRPVNRWMQEPNTPSQREALLESGSTGLEGSYHVNNTDRQGVSKEVKYNIETMTNIFRPEFAMSTDPDGMIPETSPAGWEERATACRIELDQLQYGQLVRPES